MPIWLVCYCGNRPVRDKVVMIITVSIVAVKEFPNFAQGLAASSNWRVRS